MKKVTYASKFQQKATGLVQRLTAAEASVERLASYISRVNLTLNAVIDVVGRDVVQAAFDATRRDEVLKESADNDAALEAGIANGYVTSLDAATETSVIVASESSEKDGSTIPRRFFLVPSMPAELKVEMIGKAVGYQFRTAADTMATVLEIYEFSDSKLQEYLGRQMAAAQAPAAEGTDDGKQEDEAALEANAS